VRDPDRREQGLEVGSVLLGGVREVRCADHDPGAVDVHDPQLVVLVRPCAQ
jgi:hypothetical protein